MSGKLKKVISPDDKRIKKNRTVKGTITEDEQGEITISLNSQKEPAVICPECGKKETYTRKDGSIKCNRKECRYTDRPSKPDPKVIEI